MHRVGSRVLGVLAAFGMLLAAGCSPKSKTPLEGGGVDLTEDWNTPAGMAMDASGDILVSMPNFCDPSRGASIVRIDSDGGISEWFKLPPHPETGFACPVGLAFGSDGNLYWADNQELGVSVAGALDSVPDRAEFAGKNVSRLCRIVIKDGKPVRSEILVEGFFQANGVASLDGAIYVCESSLGLRSAAGGPHKSGVYLFELKDLDPAKPIKLETGGDDEHLIYTLTTKSKDWKVGARGIAFGADGTMYVSNSGDAKIMIIKLDEFANIETAKALGEGQGMKSADGLHFDAGSGLLYCADFLGNAVHEIDPDTGKVRTVHADPEDNDGAGNKLDKPLGCLRRGDKIYVSNADLPFAGNTYDAPHTISVIDVE